MSKYEYYIAINNTWIEAEGDWQKFTKENIGVPVLVKTAIIVTAEDNRSSGYALEKLMRGARSKSLFVWRLTIIPDDYTVIDYVDTYEKGVMIHGVTKKAKFK